MTRGWLAFAAGVVVGIVAASAAWLAAIAIDEADL